MTALTHPSPNFGKRRGGALPDIIVIHYTAMADADAALQRLRDPKHQVSAHYLVGRDGTLYSLVDEADRAWHAGAGAWGASTDVNSRSIGVELDNDGFSPFAAAQMDRLAELMTGIMARWAVPPQRVIAHSDLAPGRKVDPGARFDWRRLALLGLAVWPDASAPGSEPADAAGFAGDLATFGYRANDDTAVLGAFRQRFRPGATGPLDGWDMALARELAGRFPVDVAPASA